MNLKCSRSLLVVSAMAGLCSLLYSGLAAGQAEASDPAAAAEAGTASVDDGIPKDDLFDPDAPDEATNDELGSENPTDWDGMISNSFGLPGELEGQYRPAVPERDTDVLPPTDVNTSLINESSLPLLATFGNSDGAVDSWPKGKTWMTGLLPVSRMYDLKGCKFSLKTGPISVAHYNRSGAEFIVTTDSMRPMTMVSPEPGKKNLYVSANADLYPEVDQTTIDACQRSLKGKIIAVGKFDLGSSKIALRQTKLKYTIEAVDNSPVKSIQIYLYWPAGRNDPILIDDSGLYPVMSTPIFKLSSSGKGHGFLEVVPFLTYQKGGKALTKAKLREFWGE